MNDLRKAVIQARLEVKSLIEHYRGLTELTGNSYEKEINELLDKLATLDKLEKRLKK